MDRYSALEKSTTSTQGVVCPHCHATHTAKRYPAINAPVLPPFMCSKCSKWCVVDVNVNYTWSTRRAEDVQEA